MPAKVLKDKKVSKTRVCKNISIHKERFTDTKCIIPEGNKWRTSRTGITGTGIRRKQYD